jgi:hypothetical protein
MSDTFFTYRISTVTRNSIGGWTVVYPVRDEPGEGLLVSEKHFDADRKKDAYKFAQEREDQYLNCHVKSIEHTFNTILDVMHDPQRYMLLAAQIKFLADQIRDYQGDSGDIWYIGENDEFAIGDFIPAAYWHFSHWHDGQQSWEYQTLSALGTIFSPGMTSEPEPDEPEHYPFQVLGETATSFWGHVN